ncbi:MAG: hypothetical protein JETCAE01_10700 [Anaerolineaceae bacterium]|nr:MAG: hypothetical protein JETCAE01_10700 [Anaerolineaceae bacterium]
MAYSGLGNIAYKKSPVIVPTGDFLGCKLQILTAWAYSCHPPGFQVEFPQGHSPAREAARS